MVEKGAGTRREEDQAKRRGLFCLFIDLFLSLCSVEKKKRKEKGSMASAVSKGGGDASLEHRVFSYFAHRLRSNRHAGER